MIAPQGRRESGFDWEGFGARDMQEALAAASEHLQYDEQKVWLAGSGMGGHGVWHLATHAPGQWAAISPSNGWISYRSFGSALPENGEASEIEQLLQRGAVATDTLALLGNLEGTGIYLEHDLADRRVPIDQSELMRRELADFHGDFAYRQRQTTPETSEPLAYDPLRLQYLLSHTSPPPGDVDWIELATFDLNRCASQRWLTILQQQVQLELSRVAVRFDAAERQFLATTTNVSALALDVSELSDATTFDVVLDGEVLGPLLRPSEEVGALTFLRSPSGWQQVPMLPSMFKQPRRYGGFTSLFDDRIALVYGTQGTAEENAWSLAKARFDAEMLLTRANGSVDVVADSDFRASDYPDRNVLIYGNADTNAAWAQLFSNCPVQVRRGAVRIDVRPEEGDDLGCVLVWPRAGSEIALAGAVSGTGMQGFRACDRLPYFVSGVSLPDVLVFGAQALSVGADDVRATGYFGTNWSSASGEILWRDLAL